MKNLMRLLPLERSSGGVAGACASLMLLACTSEPLSPNEDIASTAARGEICYRGSKVQASRVEDYFVIEGDIVVTDEDQWCDDESDTSGGLGLSRQGVKRQGAGIQWPGGVVPYSFTASFTADQQNAAIAAMAEWKLHVPGLQFVLRTTEADYIQFNTPTKTACNSPVGHAAGSRTINLAAECTEHRVHHEIGHALGLYHQHTRKDRDSFVTVNWQNIKGCLDTATSSANCGATACSGQLAQCGCTQADVTNDTCYMASNFSFNSSRSDLGAYDYDSVMHYGSGTFAKPGTVTLTVLLNDASGQPFPIGQRSHLSEGDTSGMRAMYPVVRLQNTAFSGRGQIDACTLAGRENDIAVQYDMSGSAAAINAHVVDKAPLLGDYNVVCAVSSTFWADNYDYPNTSVAFNPSLSAEAYGGAGTLRVMPIGLLPALLW